MVCVKHQVVGDSSPSLGLCNGVPDDKLVHRTADTLLFVNSNGYRFNVSTSAIVTTDQGSFCKNGMCSAPLHGMRVNSPNVFKGRISGLSVNEAQLPY